MLAKQDRRLVFLVCLNAVLITAIALSLTGLPQAQAQVRPNDYILIPGDIREDRQVVWIIDLASLQLTAAAYDRNVRTINFSEVINLAQFR